MFGGGVNGLFLILSMKNGFFLNHRISLLSQFICSVEIRENRFIQCNGKF
jgi:hypothetical protein